MTLGFDKQSVQPLDVIRPNMMSLVHEYVFYFSKLE